MSSIEQKKKSLEKLLEKRKTLKGELKRKNFYRIKMLLKQIERLENEYMQMVQKKI